MLQVFLVPPNPLLQGRHSLFMGSLLAQKRGQGYRAIRYITQLNRIAEPTKSAKQ